jgi:hypothetical protein
LLPVHLPPHTTSCGPSPPRAYAAPQPPHAPTVVPSPLGSFLSCSLMEIPTSVSIFHHTMLQLVIQFVINSALILHLSSPIKAQHLSPFSFRPHLHCSTSSPTHAIAAHRSSILGSPVSRAVETSPPSSTLPPPSLLWPTSPRVASRQARTCSSLSYRELPPRPLAEPALKPPPLRSLCSPPLRALLMLPCHSPSSPCRAAVWLIVVRACAPYAVRHPWSLVIHAAPRQEPLPTRAAAPPSSSTPRL